MGYFPFVGNKILRKNLDVTFNLLLELITISETKEYTIKLELVSSIRKTVLIHTASIIEALLLWKLKLVLTSEKNNYEISDEWNYYEVRSLHKTIDFEVVGGKRKRTKRSLESLDFNRIIDYSFKYEIIDEKLKERLHEVRRLRNRLHIGSLVNIDNEYSKSDLELAFSVASSVKSLCAKSS